MNSTVSRLKKSPSSKASGKAGRGTRCVPSSRRVHPNGGQRRARPTTLSATFRIWRASLPTQLERDTLLWPEIIAESVVTEASRYLNAELPEGFAERLAAK